MGTYSRTASNSFKTGFSPQSSLNNRKKKLHAIYWKNSLFLIENYPFHKPAYFPSCKALIILLETMILCKKDDDEDVDGLLFGVNKRN